MVTTKESLVDPQKIKRRKIYIYLPLQKSQQITEENSKKGRKGTMKQK